MADFEPIFRKVIEIEGGWQLHNIKGDRGGMTYAGIAQNKHPDWVGWTKIDRGEFDTDLTDMVRQFFKAEYWDRVKGDDIRSQGVAYHLYAFAVNAGIKASVQICQRIIGAMPDGVIGPKTLKALSSFVTDKKDEKLFVTMFSLGKIFRYRDIVMNDRRRDNDLLVSNIKFLCGWINRVEKGL